MVTLPLVLLAIPSVFTGWTYIEPMLFGDYFGGAIVVRPEHAVLWEMKNEWRGVAAFVQHGVLSLPFWLALAGIAAAWYCYLVNPALPARIKSAIGPVYTLLDNKYYFDRFNDTVRRRRAPARRLPVPGRRRDRHRRVLRQRLGAPGRVGGGDAAPPAVGLRLSLCVRDDRGLLRDADLVGRPLTSLQRHRRCPTSR